MKHLALISASAIFLSGCMDTQTTDSENRIVKIGNTTGVTMTQFFASNTSRTSWEEDILDGDELRSGRSVNVDIDDGSGACRFDMMAIFADGDVVVEKGFDVCTKASWTVS